jgi:sugar-specific transcriptional regulator TrmB
VGPASLLSDENIAGTLNQLGLTLLETRVYLALCKHRSLSTRAICRLTKISQPDTYRVLAKLQRKGLVEKIIKRPAKFKIVPCDKGISFLLERKKTEYINLESKTQKVLCALKDKTVAKSVETESSQFVLIPQREAVVNKINDAIERTRRSVDVFLSWKRFLLGITRAFAESSERAWNRSVTFRIVVESPETDERAEQAVQFAKKSPFCNIRFMPGRPRTVIGIYDRKEVFMIINPREGLLDSPALWSNNHSLISALQDYFDVLWLTSIEVPNIIKLYSK